MTVKVVPPHQVIRGKNADDLAGPCVSVGTGFTRRQRDGDLGAGWQQQSRCKTRSGFGQGSGDRNGQRGQPIPVCLPGEPLWELVIDGFTPHLHFWALVVCFSPFLGSPFPNNK